MFNVIRYINDKDFQIVYLKNQVNVANYEKINYMEDEKISVSSSLETIVVKGASLRVKKLLDNEILIVGDIKSIDFR